MNIATYSARWLIKRRSIENNGKNKNTRAYETKNSLNSKMKMNEHSRTMIIMIYDALGRCTVYTNAHPLTLIFTHIAHVINEPKTKNQWMATTTAASTARKSARSKLAKQWRKYKPEKISNRKKKQLKLVTCSLQRTACRLMYITAFFCLCICPRCSRSIWASTQIFFFFFFLFAYKTVDVN